MQMMWMKLKNHFKERTTLLYTDTDSFKIMIDSDDAYKELNAHFSDDLGTSNFNENTLLQITPGKSEKESFKFKEECGDNMTTCFIATSSKQYFQDTYKITNKEKCKKEK